jgi:hypothetical protein
MSEGSATEDGVADESDAGKVRVVDRRWFSAEGEAREDRPAAPAPAADPSPTEQVQPPARQAAPAQPESAEPDLQSAAVGFLDLVDFLAQQAVALLSGQVPGRGRDPITARFFIDLLGVVKDKTAGQLAAEESRLLEDVLYQLHQLYLAAAR